MSTTTYFSWNSKKKMSTFFGKKSVLFAVMILIGRNTDRYYFIFNLQAWENILISDPYNTKSRYYLERTRYRIFAVC